MIAEEDSAGAAAEQVNYLVATIEIMAGLICVFILALVTFALDFSLTADAPEDALKVAQEAAVEQHALNSEAQATNPVTMSLIGEGSRQGFHNLEERRRAAGERNGLLKSRSQRRVRGHSCGPLFGDRVICFLRRTFAGARRRVKNLVRSR